MLYPLIHIHFILVYTRKVQEETGEVFVDRGENGADFQPTDPAVPPFADVPLSEWFAKWINELKESGFTSGCGTNDQGEDIFCPFDIHTRAEAAVFFYRMVNGSEVVPPSPDPNRSFKYDDVATDDSFWYNKWIYAAYDEGIVGELAGSVRRYLGLSCGRSHAITV